MVADRDKQQGVPMYVLKDYADREIEGKFYTEEMIKVKVDENTKYRIEKVIRKKKMNGRNGYVVKWLGWGNEWSSWVSAEKMKESMNNE